MKLCYMIYCTNIRWCFMVSPGHTGGVNRRDTALAALVAALWGFNFVVIDWGMGTVPPLLFAAIRFTVVAVPACFLVPRPPVPFRTVAAVGAFMSLGQFGLLYLSMHLGMPPGLSALVLQAQVPFTIVIAAAVLRERPTRAQVAGVSLGVAGLVVVALGRGGQVRPRALALCLLAGLSWGIGNVVSRAAKAPGGLALTVWSATVVPRAPARPQPAHRRPRRRGPRPGAPGLARRPVHRLHRGAVLAGRVRDLQPAAVAVPARAGRAVGAARARGRDGQRRGRCSARRRAPPRWPARSCSSPAS